MFKDARGRSFNDIFQTAKMKEGQVNISYSYPGTIRAFHRHHRQWDFWYVVKGNLEVVRHSDDGWTDVLYLGEGDSPLHIPPEIWHGFRVLGQEEAILLYYVTNKYDPDNPDEERAEWNKFYNWETPKK